MTARLALLADNVRAAARAGRIYERIGAFEAFLSPDSDDYLLSFAVPVAESADWRADLRALRACFLHHRRLLRVEFFAELYPTLAAALEAERLRLNLTAPVMTLDAADLPAREGAPLDWQVLDPDDAAMAEAVLAVQAASFRLRADEPGHADWRRRLVEGARQGTMLVGLGRWQGRPATAAALLLGAGVAELAGVGTLEEARRRGLASALCHALLSRWFAAGGRLAWLSAGPDAQRLYRRLGFVPAGTQFNYGLKAI